MFNREIKRDVIRQTAIASLPFILLPSIEFLNKSLRKIGKNHTFTTNTNFIFANKRQTIDGRSGIFAVRGKKNIMLNLSIKWLPCDARFWRILIFAIPHKFTPLSKLYKYIMIYIYFKIVLVSIY